MSVWHWLFLVWTAFACLFASGACTDIDSKREQWPNIPGWMFPFVYFLMVLPVSYGIVLAFPFLFVWEIFNSNRVR